MDWDNPYHEINKGCLYKEDGREHMDLEQDKKLDAFLVGWSRGVNPEGEDYGEQAFEELSWNNLGYRFGLLFDETSRELKEELYYWCVKKMNE